MSLFYLQVVLKLQVASQSCLMARGRKHHIGSEAHIGFRTIILVQGHWYWFQGLDIGLMTFYGSNDLHKVQNDLQTSNLVPRNLYLVPRTFIVTFHELLHHHHLWNHLDDIIDDIITLFIAFFARLPHVAWRHPVLINITSLLDDPWIIVELFDCNQMVNCNNSWLSSWTIDGTTIES